MYIERNICIIGYTSYCNEVPYINYVVDIAFEAMLHLDFHLL